MPQNVRSVRPIGRRAPSASLNAAPRRFRAIREWLRRHRRKVIIFACVFVLLFLLMIGIAIYGQAHGKPSTPSSLDRSSARVVSPSPAPSAEPAKTPSDSGSRAATSSPSATTGEEEPLPEGATLVEEEPIPEGYTLDEAAPSPSPAPSPEPARTPPSSGFDFSTAFLVEYISPGGRIKSKSDGGEIITLEDGSVWWVYPADRINTASWTRMTYLAGRPVRGR